MAVLVPRLWPFLSHTTSSVRKSTLQTLKTLTQCNAQVNDELPGTSNGKQENQSIDTSIIKTSTNANDLERIIKVDSKQLSLNFGVKDWPANLLQDGLRHIYQRVLVEHLVDVQSLAEDVWVRLLK